jgi:hypothetical protein
MGDNDELENSEHDGIELRVFLYIGGFFLLFFICISDRFRDLQTRFTPSYMRELQDKLERLSETPAGAACQALCAVVVFFVLPLLGWYGAFDRSEIIVGQCSVTGVSIRPRCPDPGENARLVCDAWASYFHADLVTSEGVPIVSVSPLGPVEDTVGSGFLGLPLGSWHGSRQPPHVSSSFDQVVATAMAAMNCPCAADQVPNITSAFKCADEGEYCECDGLVELGVGTHTALMTAKDNQGSMRCSADEFESLDSIQPGHTECTCIPGYGPLGHGGVATRCAEEGGTCTCDGVVRYGTSECDGASRFSHWRPGMGIALPCNNDMFDDQCGGEDKYCECVSSELVDKRAETMRVPADKQEPMGFPFFGTDGQHKRARHFSSCSIFPAMCYL